MIQASPRESGNSPAERYPAGARFRVVRPGARLTGWKPERGGYSGWRRDLKVGDVIESRGFGPDFGSDPGYGIHWKVDETVDAVTFQPSQGGLFSFGPADGYLEEVAADEEARGHGPGERPENHPALEAGDPCPSCSEPMKWDAAERILYCVNDWQHA